MTDDAALDWNPVWAPDGKSLFFASDRGGTMNLWRVRIDEESGRPLGQAESVTVPSGFVAHISVSADGRRVAYSSVEIELNVQRVAMDPATAKIEGESATGDERIEGLGLASTSRVTGSGSCWAQPFRRKTCSWHARTEPGCGSSRTMLQTIAFRAGPGWQTCRVLFESRRRLGRLDDQCGWKRPLAADQAGRCALSSMVAGRIENAVQRNRRAA